MEHISYNSIRFLTEQLVKGEPISFTMNKSSEEAPLKLTVGEYIVWFSNNIDEINETLEFVYEQTYIPGHSLAHRIVSGEDDEATAMLLEALEKWESYINGPFSSFGFFIQKVKPNHYVWFYHDHEGSADSLFTNDMFSYSYKIPKSGKIALFLGRNYYVVVNLNKISSKVATTVIPEVFIPMRVLKGEKVVKFTYPYAVMGIKGSLSKPISSYIKEPGLYENDADFGSLVHIITDEFELKSIGKERWKAIADVIVMMESSSGVQIYDKIFSTYIPLGLKETEHESE